MKNFFLVLLILLLLGSGYFLYNTSQKNIELQTNMWNNEVIYQLEQQLSWMIEQFSWLQAENELLKQNLSEQLTILQQENDILKADVEKYKWMIVQDKLNDKIWTTTTNTTKNNLSKFSDTEIWVSFSYPSSWGTISKESEYNWNDLILINLLKDWKAFMTFHTNKQSPARWWFFWDMAKNITSSSYISNFCSNAAESHGQYKNCVLNTNTNWIKYTKHNYEYWLMWIEELKIWTMYWIYNPNSIFHGIVVSNVNIPNESILNIDAIINSLSFL